MLIDTSKLKVDFELWLKQAIAAHPRPLVLDIIQIGDNLASNKYVQIKQKVGQTCGIVVNLHKFTNSVKPEEIEAIITVAQKRKHGLIVQLPTPSWLQSLVANIPYQIDIDLLGWQANQLWQQEILPPTIGAIDLTLKFHFQKQIFSPEMLKQSLLLNREIVAVVGCGKLVGTPAIRYFLERQATVIAINKHTPNPTQLTRLANIILTATGQPKLITKDWIKPGCVLIDAATSESNGALVGDVDYTLDWSEVWLSPSPGGIGRLTVLYLFYNLLKLSELFG
jgi:5,10-methylene-tetrahydrofolate dehydrogenase/Methenyl tetrahydrofolate cyclohydrolase